LINQEAQSAQRPFLGDTVYYGMGLVSEMPVHHMVTGSTNACSRAQLVATGASNQSSVHTSVGQLLETGTEPWWLLG
jgi:hypothetical protein